MKLITEYSSNIKPLVEGDGKEKPKKMCIEGIFMVAEKENRNGRVYKKSVLEQAVSEYVETQVKQNRAVGEINHPESPIVNFKEASHKIVDLHWDGNNVIGKAEILDTPNGRIVDALLRGGVQIGVSSRGMGSVRTVEGVNYVESGFVLSTIDIVQDPSAHNAFVNGIMEGVEWFRDEKGILKSKKSLQIYNMNEQAKLKRLKRFLQINGVG
jgi:hypothetical protein